MRKRKSLFLGFGLGLTFVLCGTVLWHRYSFDAPVASQPMPTTKYGAFLAAQHAIYVNDFDSAARFGRQLEELDFAVVVSTRYMADFLNGYLPSGAGDLKDEKSLPAQLIYDSFLIKNSRWDEVYKRHKKDVSPLASSLRIWSSVATGNVSDALAFIDTLPTNKSWQHFARGQVYAETGDATRAMTEFAAVLPDFMNINDYLYIMSFYRHNNMTELADNLRSDFTSRPGGMFMLEYDAVPDWSEYSGYKNALSFSLVQNVSHTQIMMYSDLAILMLRMAQITGDTANQDAINYYLGQYFYTNRGDWARYFDQIPSTSPYYAFTVMRRAEQGGGTRALERIVRNNPLFIPAANNLIAQNIKNGNRRAALRVVNRAIKSREITAQGRAFFLKNRAKIYYTFGDYSAAQSDLHAASKILTADAEIVSLQAKIWATQNREIENAYDYAMSLVRQAPADLIAWDTLGRVVAAREGAAEALDLMARVARVANSCSALFEQLGDLYVQTGQGALARDAYLRAIDLSDDGLVVVPAIKKKLRKLK